MTFALCRYRGRNYTTVYMGLKGPCRYRACDGLLTAVLIQGDDVIGADPSSKTSYSW